MKPPLHSIHPHVPNQHHPLKNVQIVQLRALQHLGQVTVLDEHVLLLIPYDGEVKGTRRLPQARRDGHASAHGDVLVAGEAVAQEVAQRQAMQVDEQGAPARFAEDEGLPSRSRGADGIEWDGGEGMVCLVL